MIRAAAVLACLLLAACGQKGDLYMPDEARAVVPATAGSDAEAQTEEARRQRQQQGAAGNAAPN